jgi:large conductance mechanosensitive channel
MWREFKAFLIKQNALALAIAVVIGAALNKVVTSLVDDIIMPIVAVAAPEGAWRTATVDAGPFHFGVGNLASAIINFLIVGLVAWRISKAFIRPDEKPATKRCPFCQMDDLDLGASRCPHCTSPLDAGARVPAAAT